VVCWLDLVRDTLADVLQVMLLVDWVIYRYLPW